MMKKKWLWLLSLVVMAALVLPIAASAGEDLPGLWYGASDTEKFPNTYTIVNEEATSWGSSNESVATVADGLVTAQGEGSAFITAYGSDGVIDTWSVSVTARKVQSLSVKTDPDKTEYVATQHFDPKGLVIDVVYNNEEKETISDTSLFTYNPSTDSQLGAGDTFVTVTYGGKYVDVPITVHPLEVSSIEISKNAKTEYVVGDIPSGIEIKVNYNDGTFTNVTGGSDYSIEPNRALTEADKSLTITYEGKSATMGITVKPKAASYSVATSGTVTKSEYKVNEKFDATGATLVIKQGDVVKKELKGTALSDAINYTFKPADVGKTSMTFSFTQTVDGTSISCTLTVSGLKISAATSELEIYDVANVEMMKTKYPVGYKFTTDDIDFFTYYETRTSSKTQKIYSDEFSELSNKISLEVLTVNSRGKLTEKTSSTYRQTIQEADVQTDSKGNKFVTLLFVIDKIEFEVEVPVGDSGVYVSYSTSRYSSSTNTTSYEDIMEALDAIYEGKVYTNDSSSTTYTVKLGEDQKVVKNFRDYEPNRNIIIDLNGKNLELYATTFEIGSRNNYTITVTNTASGTSEFVYYDLDKTLLIDKNETITFDSDYDYDEDEVPGLYVVKITELKNGTVEAKTSEKNNTVTVKPENNKAGTIVVPHGQDVTFTITPDKDYEIDSVKLGTTAVNTTSNKEYSKNATTGVATYTLKNVIKEGNTLTVTFKATAQKPEEKPADQQQPAAAWVNPFTDVAARATYYDDVRFVSQKGLMNGMSSNSFGPSEPMTRAQFVTTLGRMYFADFATTEEKDAFVKNIYGTSSEFTDVSYDDPYIKYAVPYIKWATANGLILGYGDGTFGPKDNITHQQMYIIMTRYATQLAGQTVNVSRVNLSAPDANKIGENWMESARESALTAVKYAQQQNFLVSAGSIDPNGNATRAELATLLHRFAVNVLGWNN